MNEPTVRVYEHIAGPVVRIEQGADSLTLSRKQAFELWIQLNSVLGKMPTDSNITMEQVATLAGLIPAQKEA